MNDNTLDQGSTTSAFPTSGLEYTDKGKSLAQAGMTLRDYFAAKALAGMLANTDSDYEDEMLRRENYQDYCKNYQDYCTNIAESAYLFADAMMEARKI